MGQSEIFRCGKERVWLALKAPIFTCTFQDDHVFPQDDSKVFCSLDFIKLVFSNSVAGSDGLLSPADSQSVTLVRVKLHTPFSLPSGFYIL